MTWEPISPQDRLWSDMARRYPALFHCPVAHFALRYVWSDFRQRFCLGEARMVRGDVVIVPDFVAVSDPSAVAAISALGEDFLHALSAVREDA